MSASASPGQAASWNRARALPRVVLAPPRGLVRIWRRSIQVRVVSTTLVLSITVLALLGQLVILGVRDGLVNAKVDSSLAQAEAGFRAAQRQIDAAGPIEEENVGQLLTQVVTFLDERAGRSSLYEIVQFPSPGTGAGEISGRGSRTTGGLRAETIPAALSRELAARPNGVGYRFVSLCDLPAEMPCPPDPDRVVPGLAIGTQLQVQDTTHDLYFVFDLDQERETLSLVRGRLAAVGVLLVVLLAGIAFLVTRSVVRPVRSAAKVAERIAAGTLAERMVERGEDELARLASSFNRMASTLQVQIRQLEDLSRVQRRFVSDVSHELRTPLTTIQMAAEVLYEQRRSFDPQVARSAELLHTQLERFEAMLTELLEISRFDAGAAVLEPEPTDLRDVCRGVLEGLEPLARQYRGAVRLVVPEVSCVAEMDTRRIERVVRNLLLNAFEHGEGGEVVMRVGQDTHAVALTVRDHGVGLRAGEAGLVFNRFWRADPARGRRSGGTGLGLSIAMEDAHLHGGWLQAWGEPGAGASFRLTLPRVSGGLLRSSPVPLQPDGEHQRPAGAVSDGSGAGALVEQVGHDST